MAFIVTLTCHCKTVTTFKWYSGIKFICPGCKKEIDYAEAIFSGRATNNEYKPKKKRR